MMERYPGSNSDQVLWPWIHRRTSPLTLDPSENKSSDPGSTWEQVIWTLIYFKPGFLIWIYLRPGYLVPDPPQTMYFDPRSTLDQVHWPWLLWINLRPGFHRSIILLIGGGCRSWLRWPSVPVQSRPLPPSADPLPWMWKPELIRGWSESQTRVRVRCCRRWSVERLICV